MAEYYNGKTIDPDYEKRIIKIEGEKYPYDNIENNAYFYNTNRDSDPIKVAFCKGLIGKDPIDLAEKIIEHHPGKERFEKTRTEHINKLKEGAANWNQWRNENPEIRPILYEVNEKEIQTNLLCGYNFSNANLIEADLRFFDLTSANFHEANLGGAKLIRATLKEANFCRADLYKTDLSGANLKNANLQGAQIAGTNLKKYKNQKTRIINCKVYGSSAWDLDYSEEDIHQRNLEIVYKLPGEKENILKVDNLALAQFLYFVLNNKNLSQLFTATDSSIVLILGRFETKRKKVLDKIRNWFKNKSREKKYVPIIFDFDKTEVRGYTEIITVLAGISRFIIADITNAKSILQELQAIVERFQIPVIPIINSGCNNESSTEPYSMFVDYYKYNWVHQVIEYSENDLFKYFDKLVTKAEKFREQIVKKRKEKKQKISISSIK